MRRFPVSLPVFFPKLGARARRWAFAGILVGLCGVLLAGAGVWLLGSAAGLRWAVSTLNAASAGEIVVEAAEGRLAGPLKIGTLTVAGGEKRYTLRGLTLDWQPLALFGGRLAVSELSLDDLELLLPPDPSPTPEPGDLRLPLALVVDILRIGAIRTHAAPDETPVVQATDVRARLSSDGRRHRLEALSVTLDAGTLNASGELDGVKPFPLKAEAGLAAVGPPAVKVAATAGGALGAVELHLTGSGTDDDAADSGRALRATADVRLTPFAAYPLSALRLSASGLDPHLFAAAAPRARLTLEADLQATPGGELSGPLHLRNAAPAPLDRDGLPLAALDARVRLAPGALRLDDLEATLGAAAAPEKSAKASAAAPSLARTPAQKTAQKTTPPGQLAGTLDLRWTPGEAALPQGRADLAVHRLDPAALLSSLRPARLDGKLRLDGDAGTQRAELQLRQGDLELAAHLTQHARKLTLEKLRLARGAAELSGSGELALDDKRPYAFSGRLQRFDPAAFVATPHLKNSSVNATFESTGHLAPQAAGRLNFAIAGDSRLAGQAFSGQGKFDFSAAPRVIGSGQLRLGDSRLSLQGAVGGAGDVLQLELTAPALAQHGFGLAGALDLSATVAGSLARPDVVLRARARALALPGGHRLASLDADGRLQGERIDLTLAADDYRQGEATRMTRLRLSVAGTRQRHRLLADVRLAGDTALHLAAAGGLLEDARDWRNTAWRGTLDELAATGELPFKLQAPAEIVASRQRATLGATDIALAGGRVQLAESEWTAQRWRSRGSFSGLALRPGGLVADDTELVAIATRPAPDSVLRLGGEWSLAGSTRLEGRLSVRRESGDWTLPGYVPRALGLQELRLDAHSEGRQVVADFVARGSRIGHWQLRAALPLVRGAGEGDNAGAGWSIQPDAPISGRVRISVPDLSWVGPAVDSNFTSGGRLEVDGELAGTLSAPRTRGQIQGSDLALSLLDQSVTLHKGTLAARFDQEILHLDRLEFLAPQAPPARAAKLAGVPATSDPGRLTASGTIDLAKRSGQIAAEISRLPLAQRADRWIVASGKGSASLVGDLLTLGAHVTADAGFLAQATSGHPQLADDVTIVGRAPAPRRGLRIDSEIAFDLGEHFHLRAGGLEARLSGQLRLRGEPGRPLRASGAIATNDGLFDAYGQRLTVERGIVNFQGPLDNPGLNVLAVRKGLAVEAGVAVSGTAQRPVVRLVSTPAVPDPEKLSWIVLGRVPDAGGTDSSLLLAAAGAILGGQGDGITGQLAQALGVDELALRQAKDGEPLNSQILTLGKRLSARAFLSYEQGLSAAAGVMKLSYTLTPRVSLITRAGADNALDVFYTFSFD